MEVSSVMGIPQAIKTIQSSWMSMVTTGDPPWLKNPSARWAPLQFSQSVYQPHWLQADWIQNHHSSTIPIHHPSIHHHLQQGFPQRHRGPLRCGVPRTAHGAEGLVEGGAGAVEELRDLRVAGAHHGEAGSHQGTAHGTWDVQGTGLGHL